jgi:hypothetical protein
MLIQLMGILDFIAAILILLGHYHLASWRVLFIGAAYLGAKGFVFKGDWMSFVDIACAVYFIVLMFGASLGFFSVVFFIWLAYKAIAAWIW